MIPATQNTLPIKFELLKKQVDQIRSVEVMIVFLSEIRFVTSGDSGDNYAYSLCGRLFN